MLKYTCTTEPLTSASSSYALGPVDPSRVGWMGVTLSNGSQGRFLLPDEKLLPASILAEPRFALGLVEGLEGADAFDWDVDPLTFALLANRVFGSLWREFTYGSYDWAIGWLLGTLSVLAEDDCLMALVGVSYLCYLISVVPPLTGSPLARALENADHANDEIVRAYRDRLRSLRDRGVPGPVAQRLALNGYKPADWELELVASDMVVEEVA